jgi:hypothetical protein
MQIETNLFERTGQRDILKAKYTEKLEAAQISSVHKLHYNTKDYKTITYFI